MSLTMFRRAIQHQLQGVMHHNDLSDYFLFLGMPGFAEMHKFHYLEENISYRESCEYCLRHFNQVPYLSYDIKPVDIIPKTWYDNTRADVRYANQPTYIRDGMKMWLDWEYQTKAFYSKLYNDLLSSSSTDEQASALYVAELTKDVDYELADAEDLSLLLTSMNYDMPTIVSMQDAYQAKYEKKIGKIL